MEGDDYYICLDLFCYCSFIITSCSYFFLIKSAREHIPKIKEKDIGSLFLPLPSHIHRLIEMQSGIHSFTRSLTLSSGWATATVASAAAAVFFYNRINTSPTRNTNKLSQEEKNTATKSERTRTHSMSSPAKSTIGWLIIVFD